MERRIEVDRLVRRYGSKSTGLSVRSCFLCFCLLDHCNLESTHMGFSVSVLCTCLFETSFTNARKLRRSKSSRSKAHTSMDRTDEGSQCETLDLCVVPNMLLQRCNRHDIRIKHYYLVRGESERWMVSGCFHSLSEAAKITVRPLWCQAVFPLST
ncbi:hypothetical protein BKA83DRAFT_1980381 [Pisolithus microcarpus]|nr:hypothetical protein BKA83DRAFT_1980381 [Pisolithus microcarpus]